VINARGLNEMAAELTRVRGWAPGNYINICSGCRREFQGDKRAHECLPCAVHGLDIRNKQMHDALRAINRLNDHPGRYNPEIQAELKSVIDTRDIEFIKCNGCGKDKPALRGDKYCQECATTAPAS
jgi:hypothetical protein